MWNLVPQLFYDFLARVVPGASLILIFALVIYSPTGVVNFLLAPGKGYTLFTFGPILILILISYLIGFILSQVWIITIGKLIEKRQRNLEVDCKKDCIEEYNKIQKIFGCNPKEINHTDMPKINNIRDYLRHIAPEEASRLLKVRAEERLCQVLILGLLILSLVHLWYLFTQFSSERLILEIILVLSIIPFWSRTLRMRKHYINGITISWLVLTLMQGKQPAPTVDKKIGQ